MHLIRQSNQVQPERNESCCHVPFREQWTAKVDFSSTCEIPIGEQYVELFPNCSSQLTCRESQKPQVHRRCFLWSSTKTIATAPCFFHQTTFWMKIKQQHDQPNLPRLQDQISQIICCRNLTVMNSIGKTSLLRKFDPKFAPQSVASACCT